MVKIETTYSIILTLSLFFSIPVMLISFVLFLLGIDVQIIVPIFGFLFFLLIFFYFPFIFITQNRGKKYMEKNPASLDFNENQLHHALILLISQLPDDSIACGLSVLIKSLLKKNCNFKLYYCHNCEEVKNVLKNKYTSDIWIFGHGWRGGLGFKNKQTLKEWIFRENKGECLDYNEILQDISEYPKKRFIAQLHCNYKNSKRCNISLPEILLIDSSDYRNSFVSSFLMDPLSIYLTLKFRLQKRIKSTS